MLLTGLIIIAAFLAIFAGFAVKDVIVRHRQGRRYNLKQCTAALLMMLPAIVLALIFVLLPIVFSLGYAFTDYFLGANEIKWVGLTQFSRVFENIRVHGDMYHAIINTAIFVVLVVPLQIFLAFSLALIVNKKRPCIKLYRVLFFVPVAISLTVTAYLWKIILDSSEYGLFNGFLIKMGFAKKDFLLNPKTAMYWIIIVSAWQGCGYQMLIFLSGLSNINESLYEAASLDGANKLQQVFHVTLPGLRSVSLFILITVFTGACKVMVQPWLMTGKQDYTITLNYLMYLEGKSGKRVGYSSAIALLMTVVIGAVTLLQRWLLREKD